jgi:glycosyltransferase involved in cell wall biosynthesis
MNPANVTIIIPAYQEQSAIGEVVSSMATAFPEAEILVINDGSTDRTAAIAAEAGAVVIEHQFRKGYGAAVCTGVRAATREYILTCDADGQHTANEVSRLIASSDGFDMVVGARTASSYRPLLRRPGKFILSRFAEMSLGVKVPDINSGLRIFRRSVILRYLHLMPRGFSFSTTSTFAVLKGHYRYKYIPIETKKRKGSSSVRQVVHGPQIILLMLRLMILFEPLRFFLFVSTLLGAGAAGSLFRDLWTLSETGISDTTVILVVSSLVVFMGGLLCDQISALRREIHE